MTALLSLYNITLRVGEPLLQLVLKKRLHKGKEDPARLQERMGIAKKPRPVGKLLWVHAASVGEAQSALALIEEINKRTNMSLHILVTSGTTTSATLMHQRLPANAFHQYAVIDHPAWIKRFLDHWKPDLALWMESELWPNTLLALKKQCIPALLINGRLSDKSFSAWSKFPKIAKEILGAFALVLTQTKSDEQRFITLGARAAQSVGNIKFSAAPLPYSQVELAQLKERTARHHPVWVFASTHAGEEEIACIIHNALKEKFPSILTLLVPRHPARRDDIVALCKQAGVPFALRTLEPAPQFAQHGVYIVDTMGELGLFYALSPLAVIGRSFSLDGGGGHNPIEAAQMGCVVLTGPNNQFQRPLYDDMAQDHAVIEVQNPHQLQETLLSLMGDEAKLLAMKQNTQRFLTRKSDVITHIMDALMPYIQKDGTLS